MPLDYKRDARYVHLSPEQVRGLYEVEKGLRARILNCPADERSATISWAYEELFRRCPWHPALTERSGTAAPDLIRRRVLQASRFLPSPKLQPPPRILEIGCGNGELSLGLCAAGYDCCGIDVSTTRISRLQEQTNGRLLFIACEATHIPLPDKAFDAAISMQLLEHLHPDDVSVHLQEVARTLRPKGCYIIETPNRHYGPHDVSRFFAPVAEGFHLKEFTVRELCALLHKCGFGRVSVVLRWRRVFTDRLAQLLEMCAIALPPNLRRKHTFGLHNPLFIAHIAERHS